MQLGSQMLPLPLVPHAVPGGSHCSSPCTLPSPHFVPFVPMVVVVVFVVVLVVVLLVVVVVVAGQTSVTMPPLSVVTAPLTQLLSTRLWGEPPSGHVPALLRAAENLPVAFEMQPESRAIPLAAAFE